MNSTNSATDKQINNEAKLSILKDVSKFLTEAYIFPDIAKSIEKKLFEELEKGKFDHVDNITLFAEEIDKILQEISKDKHLHIVDDSKLLENIISQRDGISQDKERIYAETFEQYRLINFGFKRLEVLEGNVGYLDLRGFCHPSYALETAKSAMSFLANTDAIIFDFRENNGGDPEMVSLLASYFFEERTLWNMIDRPYKGIVEEYWTTTQNLNGKSVGKDVYILTSSRTFSAGEDFAYGMKYQKKGTVVGEKTKGGAHPCDPFSIQDKLVLIIPTGRSINPITNSNWEGTGVEPDIAIPADQAFDLAYEMALDNLKLKRNT